MTFVNKHISGKYAVIDTDLFPRVQSRTHELYCITPDLITYEESMKQYSVDGLRSDDVVIDIGANIGAFSFRAAKRCKVVHAFEPVLFSVLQRNVEANNLNVIPHFQALGYNNVANVEWGGDKHTVPALTLSEMIDLAGGCDFLKCDCEGAEWSIKKEELSGIRRIEIEYHNCSSVPALSDFTCTTKQIGTTMWVSGVNKNE